MSALKRTRTLPLIGLIAVSAASPSLAAARKAVSIAAGYYHTCAVLDDASVKCWGYSGNGQLGLGDTNTRGTSSNQMGDNLPVVSLGTGRTAKMIAASSSTTCALLDNATVKCWGYNGSGQLGLGDANPRGTAAGQMGDALLAIDLGTGLTALQIAVGNNHNCALLSDKSIKCWGYNGYGQLGIGDTVQRGSAVNQMGDNLKAVSLGTGRTALQIAVSGGYSTCALLDNSTVKCWGYNNYGQLGQGDTVQRGSAVNQMGDNLVSVNLGTGRLARSISAFEFGFCVTLDNETLKCWGGNDYGQLGVGDTNHRGDQADEMGDNLPTTDLVTGLRPRALSCQGYHCCIALITNTMKCWGAQLRGELGTGDTIYRAMEPGLMGENLPYVDLGPLATVKSVSVGYYHSCAILNDGAVKCWGYNGYGELGTGDTANRGMNSADMGASLPAINL